MPKKIYTQDSIQSLNPREFTRLRPQIYCGNTEYSTQLLVEILSNAIDEYNIGNGNRIIVRDSFDDAGHYWVQVSDQGQGFIPGLFRDDGKTVLEAAFSVLNTSGKFKNDGVYEGSSLGSYGVGSKLTNFLSLKLVVSSCRDGKCETVTFHDGLFSHREISKCDKNKHGTCVYWEPDPQFFTCVEIKTSEVRDLIHTITCLCPGLVIEYNDEEFFSKNGLVDLVNDKIGDNEILKDRFIIDSPTMKLVMTYISSYTSTVVPYVNTGLTEKGLHITSIKSALTREINKFFREKKWLKDKDDNYSGDDIQEGLYLVFNLTAKGVAYDAQVKNNVSKIDMTDFLTTLTDSFSRWAANHEKDLRTIYDRVSKARKAREAAQKARDAIRGTGGGKKDKLLSLPTKLVDAWSNKREKCELFIVEGDSAAGGLVKGRASEFQAVFPIRGKIISLAGKNSLDKIFSNQEIINIIKALGLELDNKTHKLIFNAKKLRYGKIVMATDADADGAQIKNLLLTAFWNLCPELVTNGYIYAAIPPLFRVTTKKNEYLYFRGASELEEYKKQHSKENFLVNRNKGLGEQDAEELAICLLNEKTRRLEQIVVDNYNEADTLFDTLMGTNVPARREWLLAHAEETPNE